MCEFCPIFSEHLDDCLTDAQNNNLEWLKKSLRATWVHFYGQLDDEDYNKLLNAALSHNNYEMAELLLASSYYENFHKYNPDFFDNFDEEYKEIKDSLSYNNSKIWFLHQAMQAGESAIVKFFITHNKVNFKEYLLDDLKPDLHQAVCYQDVHQLESLLADKKKEMLSVQDDTGWTALHYAVKHENCDAVKLLLDKQRELISVANNAGNTPLLEFMKDVKFTELSVLVLKLLLAYGAEVNDKNSKQETALELLLCNTSQIIHDGWLKDNAAKRSISLKLLELLLEMGADPGQELSSGENARAYVKRWYDDLEESAFKEKILCMFVLNSSSER